MSKPTTPSVPFDLHHDLNEIAGQLHSGHAAVMVGSGFSKNAKPRRTSAIEFPNWTQLGDLFYRILKTKKPDSEARYVSIPTLAHEVEAAIGRTALNQKLRTAIPDLDYDPSPLHVSLLELPWNDVFTTNYDTLLECACLSTRKLSCHRPLVILSLARSFPESVTGDSQHLVREVQLPNLSGLEASESVTIRRP